MSDDRNIDQDSESDESHLFGSEMDEFWDEPETRPDSMKKKDLVALVTKLVDTNKRLRKRTRLFKNMDEYFGMNIIQTKNLASFGTVNFSR